MRLRGKFFSVLALVAAPAFAQADGPPLPPGTDPRFVSHDKVDYDEVGYAAVGGGEGVSATHPSLPVPSYIEVTALDSGRTVLVRVAGNAGTKGIIHLSPAAAEQLGVSGDRIAVRARRTNPPAFERTALDGGGRANERLPTPPALLNALRKRLSTTPAPVADLSAKPAVAKPAKPKPVPAAVARTGTWFVQVAALSNEARARSLASSIGGTVQAAGKVWRVRAGPYASEAAARSALPSLRAKGYGDARVVR